MTVTPSEHVLRLEPFTRLHAPTIAAWVKTEQELRWLAPSTAPPLSADKVLGWLKPGWGAFLLVEEGDPTPIGYAELNPMRRAPDQLWIGHVIVRPDRRGQGLGRRFVERLVADAFSRGGVTRVSLIVFPENTAAIECYRGVGFTFTGEEYHQYRDSERRERLLRFEIRPSQLT